MRATHTIVLDSEPYWNSLSSARQLAGKRKPDHIPMNMWTQNVAVDDYPHEGRGMAYWVTGLLDQEPEVTVMIDELSAGHLDDVSRFCEEMPARHNGRWGLYLVNGPHVNYANLQPAIDRAIEKGATFGLEFYYEGLRETYVALSQVDGVKVADDFLREHYAGPGRASWLMRRGLAITGEAARFFPMFSPIDRFAGTKKAGLWLDRQAFCWNTTNGFFRRMSMTHGIGSWVWDGDRISTTARDLVFNGTCEWYQNGSVNSRMGVYRG